MRPNELHQLVVSEDDMVDVLYRGVHIDDLIVDQPTWIERFNRYCAEFDLPVVSNWDEESTDEPDKYIQDNLSDWNLPDEYVDFDLAEFLLSKCSTNEQIERVELEIIEFANRDMLGVLVWMKYFVDTLRKNNLVWGVGRGSSVSSYVLFLLEVHKVDSLKYDLSIKEFLK